MLCVCIQLLATDPLVDVGGMARLNHIKALLIDLNGTVHVGQEATPRAVQAIAKLRQAKFPFIFWLSDMGVKARKEEVLTSLGACRQLTEDRKLRPYLLLSPSAKAEFSHIPSCALDEHDSVIIGLHPPALAYESLNTAFRILKGEPRAKDSDPSGPSRRSKPVLIAPHTASFMQSAETEEFPAGLSLGIGPFVRALESAAGIEAEIVGKPTKRFFELAIDQLRSLYPDDQVDVGEIAVVGDDVENDQGQGAIELGLQRILVRTGKYRSGDENANPHAVLDTFADFVNSIV